MCIGRRFATLEVYLLAIKVLQRYRLEHHHPKTMSVINEFVNKPSEPLKIKFVKRN